jgi:hypothetical protein
MNDDVIRALLTEKANLIQAGVRMPADSEERFVNDAAIALLDLQVDKCRERLDVKRRREATVIVRPMLRVA